MATNVVSNDPYLSPRGRQPRPAIKSESPWVTILRPLASLKLTVVLFAFAIFIIFAGTVAQVNADVWTVVHHYFRSFFTWIDFQIFFPRTTQVAGGFPFPGGWLIGLLLIVNLLAAHALRFKVQAHGTRLFAGLAVIAAGILITWGVIQGAGSLGAITATGAPGGAAVQSALDQWLAQMGATILWNGLKLGLAGLLAATVYFLATLDWSRRLELGLLSAATVVEACVLAGLVYRSDYVPDPSSMRILWQLVQGGFVGLVLLAGCVLAFKKRGAIVLIHAGIALMMFNELYVGMTSQEAQMRMTPGAVHNYVEDIRTVELAVVDPSGKTQDNVVVVPKQMLLSDGAVRDDRLPFDVKVVDFMQNADIRRPIPKGQANRATAGIGLEWFAVPERAGTGTDTDSKVDISAAYLTLEEKGTDKPLGTYLVSLAFENPQPVVIDGKTYGISLRFKRTYKPYVVQLLTTAKQNYPGTNTPKSFSSDIHLIDPTNHTDRDNIHIWMNNPLRYNGETFYQSGFGVDPKTGEPQTTLTVVANRGWMIPYIGCMIVAVGLLSHFLTVLTRFLRRRASGSLDPREEDELVVPLAELARDSAPRGHAWSQSPPEKFSWAQVLGEFFPWIAVAVLVGWAVSFAVPPRSAPDAMNLYKFGELPVVYEGRVKPFDTLARNALKAISDRQTWMDGDKHSHPAIEWLLDVVCDPEVAATEPVFHIDDPELRDMLGLVAKSTSAEKDLAARSSNASKTEADKAAISADESFLRRAKDNRYSIADFRDGLKEFGKQWKQADTVAEAERTPLQRQIVEFAHRLGVYRAVQDSFQPLDLPPLPSAEEIRKDPQSARAVAEEIGRMLREDMPKFHADLAQRQVPLSVPPDKADGQWEPFATAIDQAFIDRVIHGTEGNPNTVALAAIFHDYVKKDVTAFNASVAKYAASLEASPPKMLADSNNSSLSIVAAVSQKLGLIQHADKLDFEAFFNHFEPFYYGLVLYLIAFIIACFAMLGWSVPLNRAAFWLVAATLVLHTAAMIGRIYISGRPPVTNLYSAALFIGWAGVGLGLLLELIYRLGIGTMIAAFAGFMTLLIAHFLASSGDTFTVMQAVLDTQFWLATHVVCITLGYATTFIAGLLGVRYVVEGVLTGGLSEQESKALVRMIYGVLCFAIFFSFVGTVLGGLWADDSWGRFWGWDPKENGALIIVIWNALVLHARWDGMVKDRGLAVLAIGGNIAVAWSGFGVNELGAGLHSYGFTNGVALWLSIFVASQLALIVMGSLPKRLWRSFRDTPPPAIT